MKAHRASAAPGIGTTLVSARSYREYVAMFALTDADLAGRVLDCPGGAAGFAASAVAHPEWYVPRALPHLPFPDATFDLVLSSHLLFTYGDRLDDAFHLAAPRELARVARGQVRAFPLLGHVDGRAHPTLDAVRGQLAATGITTTVRANDGCEFQAGGDQVLVLEAQARPPRRRA